VVTAFVEVAWRQKPSRDAEIAACHGVVGVHFYRTLRRRRVEVDEGVESGRIGVDDSPEWWSSARQWNIAPMEESGPNTE
jgi:hypothetical protein